MLDLATVARSSGLRLDLELRFDLDLDLVGEQRANRHVEVGGWRHQGLPPILPSAVKVAATG